MRRFLYCVVALALLYCAGSAQTPPVDQSTANVPKVLPATAPLGTGPFKAIMEAASTFQGHQCSLCTDPQWVTRKKKIE